MQGSQITTTIAPIVTPITQSESTQPTNRFQQPYEDFLRSKEPQFDSAGFTLDAESIHPMLFDFQRDIVQWAVAKGKAALFTATGTGKTLMQLEYAKHVAEHTSGDVLVLAPLAVAGQTVAKGQEMGIEVTHCRKAIDIQPGINITNYEMLHHFIDHKWDGIVLDESSILKNFSGSTRKEITDFARAIPYRLACTATPAPNDLIEIINHAEFLGVMSGKEIIALYFKQDGNTTHQWRLKRHAVRDFYRWLATWAVALRRPSDLGYSDEGFIRPPVNWQHIAVPCTSQPTDRLFHVEAQTLTERRQAKRDSIDDRVRVTAELVNASDESWVVWCNLNDESKALTAAIDGAVELTGSEPAETKEQKLMDFASGKIKKLVTKSVIAGFGLNWQHCHNTAYVGLSDSFEALHQSISRFDRYGQTEQVNAYVITAETEGAILENIRRKQAQFEEMMDGLVREMGTQQLDRTKRDVADYQTDAATGNDWLLYQGDCIDMVNKVQDESVDLIIYSPPFPGMYAYSNSPNDIGNTTGIDEMIEHYRYLAKPLLRILKPGRIHCVHLMQLTAMLSRDGYIGIKDYRGAVIQMMQEEGWIYSGEHCIDKNPQIQATRNKEIGLLFKTLATDSSKCRAALPDYLLKFTKPGENKEPVRAGISNKYNPGGGWITEQEWIEWAAPVWYRQTKDYPGGIRETDVLNVAVAREADDERHLCPLQLGVIERAVKLWSNPGDVVFSPFAGIGSEGYQSLLLDRAFVGIELKRSYWETACRNLEEANRQRRQGTLFDGFAEMAS